MVVISKEPCALLNGSFALPGGTFFHSCEKRQKHFYGTFRPSSGIPRIAGVPAVYFLTSRYSWYTSFQISAFSSINRGSLLVPWSLG